MRVANAQQKLFCLPMQKARRIAHVTVFGDSEALQG
jgi:hypothetical protein